MTEFGLSSLDSTPTDVIFSQENFLDKTTSQRKDIFVSAIRKVVDKYIYCFEMKNDVAETDHVKEYGKELLSLGLLYIEYCDAIHEGDGLRILRCWKYMLLIFKAHNKRKYAIQASTLLFQYYVIFSERMKHQLLWSRTVNTHGRPGRNIPMDLHMEHLNRELKDAICHLSSNVNDTTIQRIGMCLRKLIDVKNNYDSATGIQHLVGYHSSRKSSLMKDLMVVIEELQEMGVFVNSDSGREHSQFHKFSGNTVSRIEPKKLNKWLKKQLDNLVVYQ